MLAVCFLYCKMLHEVMRCITQALTLNTKEIKEKQGRQQIYFAANCTGLFHFALTVLKKNSLHFIQVSDPWFIRYYSSQVLLTVIKILLVVGEEWTYNESSGCCRPIAVLFSRINKIFRRVETSVGTAQGTDNKPSCYIQQGLKRVRIYW